MTIGNSDITLALAAASSANQPAPPAGPASSTASSAQADRSSTREEARADERRSFEAALARFSDQKAQATAAAPQAAAPRTAPTPPAAPTDSQTASPPADATVHTGKPAAKNTAAVGDGNEASDAATTNANGKPDTAAPADRAAPVVNAVASDPATLLQTIATFAPPATNTAVDAQTSEVPELGSSALSNDTGAIGKRGTRASTDAHAVNTRAGNARETTSAWLDAGTPPGASAAPSARSLEPAIGDGKTHLLALAVVSANADASVANASLVPAAPLAGLASNAATSVTANATTSAALASQTLQAPVGSHAWGQEVANAVRSFVADRIDVAELKLNPEELGPIRVEIALDQAGQAAVHFSAAREETRQALSQQFDQLRTSLADSGVTLRDASTGNFSEGRAFNFLQQQARDGRQPARVLRAGEDVGVAPVGAAGLAPVRARSAVGNVDLYA